MSPFVYEGNSPYARTDSPLTLPPPPSMMHMPAMVPAPPHIYSPAELNIKTVHHTIHYPTHNPAAVSNWWPRPNHGPIRMNTNWNPHSLNAMMYTNHHALTMNPYFMANPYANLTAQYYMQNGMNAGEAGQPGKIEGAQMEYNGDGFQNPFVHPGQEAGCQEMEGSPNQMLV